MGYKYEVHKWVYSYHHGYDFKSYDYEQVIATNSLFMAARELIRAKISGSGCVKLEWRG